jgi:hypothetical protein
MNTQHHYEKEIPLGLRSVITGSLIENLIPAQGAVNKARKPKQALRRYTPAKRSMVAASRKKNRR